MSAAVFLLRWRSRLTEALCPPQRRVLHGPQLAASPHPLWAEEADCRVHLSAEGASSSGALHQAPPGQPHLPLTLLRLPQRPEERVSPRSSSGTCSWGRLPQHVSPVAAPGGAPCAWSLKLRRTATSTRTTAPTPAPSAAPPPRTSSTPARTSCPPSSCGGSSGWCPYWRCWGTRPCCWCC